jgi:RNA polymerase sigma-32 factor
MNYYLANYNDCSDVSISFKEYLRKISNFPMLTHEEETRLMNLHHNENDRQAGQILVQSHLKLVVKMAVYYKYKGCDLPIMDLISEGTLGLIEAIKKFDISKQCRLATYAIHHIRAKMYDFIMNSFSLVKLGASKTTKTLFGKYKDLMNANSDEEIIDLAEDIDTSIKNVNNMKARLSMKDCSLNSSIDSDSHNEFVDQLACERDNPEELIVDRDERVKYLSCIRTACEKVLNQEEKEIIYHRIIAEKPLKLREVADLQGVSPEAIRQKQERALGKIRNFIEKNGLLKNDFITPKFIGEERRLLSHSF